MEAEDDLRAALHERDIRQVQWALYNGADPRAHRGHRSLLELAASLGFIPAL